MKDIDLQINTELAKTILVGFIKSETSRVGYSKVVIGLSGGIDSALACTLAAEALGPENVLALRNPYRDSSPESLEHAKLVIDALGVQSKTIEITSMVDPMFKMIPGMDKKTTRQCNGACTHDHLLRPICGIQWPGSWHRQ